MEEEAGVFSTPKACFNSMKHDHKINRKGTFTSLVVVEQRPLQSWGLHILLLLLERILLWRDTYCIRFIVYCLQYFTSMVQHVFVQLSNWPIQADSENLFLSQSMSTFSSWIIFSCILFRFSLCILLGKSIQVKNYFQSILMAYSKHRAITRTQKTAWSEFS